MDEIDVGAIVKDISGDLFPKTEDLKENNPDPGLNPEPSPQDPSPQPQMKALPKSWKKEMEAHWTKLDPSLHDYIYQREADVMRGLQEYSTGYKQWNALIEPYKEMLQAYPNANPVQLMQALMNAHLELARAPDPAQKRSVAAKMLKAYGIDLDTPQGQQPDPNSELLPLRQRLETLESHLNASQRSAAEAAYKQNLSAVEKFASDPANVYFDEVANDIPRFLGKVTGDLKEAYDLACYANPVVRQKMQAQQPAKPPEKSAESFPNLNANGSSKPRQQRPGSMDDTINAVIAKHYSTH